MKVQSKDTIISQLIELLKNVKEDHDDYQIQTGWIEALMWTIGLTEDEKNVFKYSKEEIRKSVVDMYEIMKPKHFERSWNEYTKTKRFIDFGESK